MRIALALVALTAPAFADEPGGTPTAPAGGSTPAQSVPGPQAPPDGQIPASDPAVDPAVDPAYGERPDPTAPPPSVEDDRYVRGVRYGREIVIRYHADRTRKNIMVIAATAGAGALVGLVGAYFHLDSRSASNDVSADHYLGTPWTTGAEDTYDRAHRSATLAGVMYGFGGALLLTSAIAYMVTEPKLETRVIHPHTNRKPITMLAPLRGGAVLGTGWTF